MTLTPQPPAPLTRAELEEMKQIARQVTEAKWRYIKPPESEGEYIRIGGALDAQFIGHARTDWPRCIAEIERLRAGLKQITTKECHSMMMDGSDDRYGKE